MDKKKTLLFYHALNSEKKTMDTCIINSSFVSSSKTFSLQSLVVHVKFFNSYVIVFIPFAFAIRVVIYGPKKSRKLELKLGKALEKMNYHIE